MYVVYVLDKDGNPLMPTKRFGHVRRMLKSGQAKVVSTKPFVIQLQYEPTKYTQPLYGGTDPGRTNIGEAMVNQKGEVVYAAQVKSRNKDIPKLMAERAAHRKASRRGERLRRKRRAKKNGTATDFPEGRKLPGYRDGTMALKDIINTESKFNNRKRPSGWITPTVRQCIQTHVNVIRKIQKILPVTDWTLEYNKFSFMMLENGQVYGVDFQNGRMKGYGSVNDYIDALQGGHCIFCENPIEHHHHIVPRHKGGSNTPENIVGLCNGCHTDVHQNRKCLDRIGLKKKYAGTSVLNASIPFIYDELVEMFGEDHTHLCDGLETADARYVNGIQKDHFSDAVCIAAIGAKIDPVYDSTEPFRIQQFRNHDRQIVKCQKERSYQEFTGEYTKSGKPKYKTVAKNRKTRFEQPEEFPALSVWYKNLCKEAGRSEARRQRSELRVVKSARSYNSKDRVLPGAVFRFGNKCYVMTGQITNGGYFRAYNCGKQNFRADKCSVVSTGNSLVYVS